MRNMTHTILNQADWKNFKTNKSKECYSFDTFIVY